MVSATIRTSLGTENVVERRNRRSLAIQRYLNGVLGRKVLCQVLIVGALLTPLGQ
jgi:hypothetical protein